MTRRREKLLLRKRKRARGLRTILPLLPALLSACATPTTSVDELEARPRTRASPGEGVWVVRFEVEPERRAVFEDFFWSSLKPAATVEAAPGTDPIGSFRLLIPSSVNRNDCYTYYVLVDPVAGEPSGQTMRDSVRKAFPGPDGEQRIQRWMSSIVLGERSPRGALFVEADLEAEGPPDRSTDGAVWE